MNKRSRQSGLYLFTTFVLLLSGAIAQTAWTDGREVFIVGYTSDVYPEVSIILHGR